jgi:hypothetical protein
MAGEGLHCVIVKGTVCERESNSEKGQCFFGFANLLSFPPPAVLGSLEMFPIIRCLSDRALRNFPCTWSISH